MIAWGLRTRTRSVARYVTDLRQFLQLRWISAPFFAARHRKGWWIQYVLGELLMAVTVVHGAKL